MIPRKSPRKNDAHTRRPATTTASAARGNSHTKNSPSTAVESVTASHSTARMTTTNPAKRVLTSSLSTWPWTVPRAARRSRARGDVATNVRARQYGRLPVEHGDTAVDAPADDCVAVQHERVAGDVSVDPEVAVAHVHGAVHAAVDAGRAVGRNRRSVDGLAVRHDEPARHADAAAVLVSVCPGRRRDARSPAGTQRQLLSPRGLDSACGDRNRGERALRGCAPRYGCGEITDACSPSSDASTAVPNASGAGPLSAVPSRRLRARHAT